MPQSQAISKSLVFILALLVIFCPLGIDLYLPAFQAMQQGLNVAESKIQQTISVYMLTVGLGQLVAGPLADKYGRKPIANAGIVLFTIGAILASLVDSWLWMMVARAMQGFGACATFVAAFAIVRDSFGHKGSGQMITYLNGIVCFIPALAPLLGAWLTLEFGWRSNFVFLAGFAALGLLLMLYLYRETKPADSIYQGHILDLRRFKPMVTSSEFMFNASITLFGMAAMLVFVTTAPGWVMNHLNGSVADFTSWFTGNAVLSIIASFCAPILIKRHSRLALIVGLTLFMLGGVTMLWASQYAHPAAFMLPMYVASIGFAFSLGSAAGKALSGFAKQAGTASALIGVMQMSGAGVLALLTQQLHLTAPHQLALHLLITFPFLLALLGKNKQFLHSAV
ncbi:MULTISPECIES: multidrug effflux MFS transporter [Pseudoalteromonas]|uniref:Bcr/CflA family efflux transporter n=1 Tax=Pseudoalteromonas amylolytica TaxID=1859457 RepID=A0A1S1MYC0_9GAMM|nr:MULTISPECIES: multidrug effflux MFS transporter [Pseudoalteromonas]OHU89297.1 Bcr/CflA family drug resistance efflux transporter [Pseudoalteromonas sp. JW3]OHU92196.1 Bcr/CflA family drug resistance efflux transporter [Pseudoalteromonas amylolytica]